MRCSSLFLLIALSRLADAQTLPELSVNALTNRYVAISWPYTNSAFALQQSAALSPGSSRRRSAFVPAFEDGALFGLFPSNQLCQAVH
jgi:hypothetical protein